VGSTTTQTTIANRALQIVGYQPISSIQENSRGAKAMNRAYQPVLYSELRKNYWNFATVRASLPQAAVGPTFGPSNYFPLPPDFLCIAPPDQTFGVGGIGNLIGNGILSGSPIITGSPITDWLIEGNQIASNQAGPLNIRYISNAVTESMFDPCFDEAFSAALATMCCEELTQSNTKLAACAKIYEDAIETAKKRNAFDGRPIQPPTDSFVIARF
jgi:hypothetical protein